MNKAFSIKEAFSFGWTSFKKDAIKWVGMMITFAIISIIVGNFSYHVDPETFQTSGSFLGNVLGWVVNTVLTIGVLTIAVKTVRSQKSIYADLFTACDSFKKFFNMFFVNVLTGIVVFIGFLLLIVPGIIAMMMFYLAPYFVAVENMGPIEAMKRSAKETKGHKMDLFIFGLASIGIIILGALALGVGLLVAVPVVVIAGAYVYDRITKGGASEGVKDADVVAEEAPQDVLDPVVTTEGK